MKVNKKVSFHLLLFLRVTEKNARCRRSDHKSNVIYINFHLEKRVFVDLS
jgi:hypothetical protein